MNKILLIPLAIVILNCSGIAPEAERNDSNPLVKPPFMETNQRAAAKTTIVEIYTKPTCPYCIKAKALLDFKKITYKEYNVTENPALKNEAIERSGGRLTVPQIFINSKYIGGYSELRTLEQEGSLDKLIAE